MTTDNILLAGFTESFNAISTPGGFKPSFSSPYGNYYLVKFNSAGVRQWGTYYGDDACVNYGFCDCTTDLSGNVFLCGDIIPPSVTSTVISTVLASPGCYQDSSRGISDAFLAKFASNGSRVWSTYYGGAYEECGWSCVTNNSGHIYMAGLSSTNSGTDVATPGSYQPNLIGNGDAYIVKFYDSTFVVQTNVANLIYENGIKIFPNPTSGQFTLVFDRAKEKAEIKIFNSLSQIVSQKNISSTDKISLSISDQASGVYFVEVNADGEKYRTKVVKE